MFGVGGKVSTDFGAHDQALDVAAPRDGKIIAIGHRDSITGWMSRASATTWSSTPGTSVSFTALSLNSRL